MIQKSKKQDLLKYGSQKKYGRCGEGNTTTTLSLHRTSAIIGGAK